MNLSIYCRLGLMLLALGSVNAVAAKEVAVGDPVPAFSAKDQFGKDFTFAPGPRYLLFAFDMAASKAANAQFTALGQGGLDKLGIVYVMDIHSMPAIGRFFALPKMRKYPFRVVLAESAEVLKPFPRRDNQLTILVLWPNGTIRAIRYWDPQTEDLAKVLE